MELTIYQESRIEFLDDPKIVDALKRALDRGVKVKIYVGINQSPPPKGILKNILIKQENKQ